MVRWTLDLGKFIFESRSLALNNIVKYWCWWNLRTIGWADWEKKSHTRTQYMSITSHPLIWNLHFRFKECNQRLILVNYGHDQTVGFGERCGRSWVKVGRTQLNLIDGPVNTRLCEIHFRILVTGIEEYGDILVFGKFETNWMVRLWEQNHTGTQHMFITRHP